MDEAFSGPTMQSRQVSAKASASMRFNSDPISNEIDESDLEKEKHHEPRILP
jgi:hypothetical protein